MTTKRTMAAGPHLNEEGLRFLRGLKRNNDRDWFNARKAVYESELKQPMLAVIAAVNERMLAWAPEHVRAPEKILMRIYRDIRFSPDKRPYKVHVAAWWARQGMEKTSGAGFYLDVSPERVQVAAGVYMPERAQLLALREFLMERHAAVRAALGARPLTKLGFAPMAGQPLTRPPKGFAHAGEADNLIRQREWGVSAELPASLAQQTNFASEVTRRLQACAELVALLNEPLLRRPRTGLNVAPILFR